MPSGSHHIPDVQNTDWYSGDEHLQWLVRRSVGEAVWPTAEAAMRDAGTLVPQQIEPLMPVVAFATSAATEATPFWSRESTSQPTSTG